MIKLAIAFLIAITPFNFLRIILYRFFFNYKIDRSAKIYPFNLLLVKKLEIEKRAGIYGYFNMINNIQCFQLKKNSFIGSRNKFLNLNSCIVHEGARIVSRNILLGTPKKISPFKEFENIRIGKNSNITYCHRFDLSDEIYIGEDVTFGGTGIEVWTHGFDLERTKVQAAVRIGDNCYIGSRSLITPGINICNHVAIGAGTIISKSINESGFYTSSNLIKKTDLKFYRNHPKVAEKNGYLFYRKN